jgi:glycosyltransferase involved in cell wall biosynthesis
MRVLYLSQYFFPEMGATQIRAYENSSNWVRLGHQVTMIAEIPNHPAGIVPLEFRGKLYQRDTLDGIDVIRVWVKASPVKDFRNRMLFYLSYMVSASLAGLFLSRGHYDLIYASSPPLFVGGAALTISLLKRIPFIFEVRDLWPESAVALGELRSPKIVAWATRFEEACYHRAKKVIVVTRGALTNLLERGVPVEKIELVPNGANTELFDYRKEDREKIRAELGLQNKLVAIYAGIHGVAQNLETVIEAARLLRQETEIHFLLIGEGPRKRALEELVQNYHLSNVTMLPGQSHQAIPSYLSAANVAIIPLRDVELFRGTVPSKIYDAWACRLPILLSVDGEARQIMKQANAGQFIQPGDAQAIASALIAMKDNLEAWKVMGENGRDFTVRNYSRRAQAEKLAQILESSLF